MLMRFNLSTFPLEACVFGVIFRKLLPNLGHKEFPLCFLVSFVVLCLKFRSSIYLKYKDRLSLVGGVARRKQELPSGVVVMFCFLI